MDLFVEELLDDNSKLGGYLESPQPGEDTND